ACHLVTVRVVPDLPRPQAGDLLRQREDAHDDGHNGSPPVSTAPHVQYDAPNTTEHASSCINGPPKDTMSTPNAPPASFEHRSCSTSISEGHRLNPVRCRVSVANWNGPADACATAPEPASDQRCTAPIRINFASDRAAP